MEQQNIRNFCIIAHIDHGKSTLADRFLDLTKTVENRKMKEQMLDQMDLERERGITIKLQPVRMNYCFEKTDYILNLIDTPGHIDFNYEVSRSLAAVEGAILLVDATQGIQAQTLGNLYLALAQDLMIIPVINKIDLPNAKTDIVAKDISNLLGVKEEEIMKISAKTGEGVKEVLEKVIKTVHYPQGDAEKPLRALVFDSDYDTYKGVVAFVRMVDGRLKKNEKIILMASGAKGEALEVGTFHPQLIAKDALAAGEIGYISTGLKEVELCRVGDTITKMSLRGAERRSNPELLLNEDGIATPRFGGARNDIMVEPLAGYTEPKPMVYASIYPIEGEDFDVLKDGFGKLKLSDSSLFYELEASQALGRGFRCGFLGLLHLEIVAERLRREFKVELIVTTPSVVYKIKLKNTGQEMNIFSPSELPDRAIVAEISEPWVNLEIITPKEYYGQIMTLLGSLRGNYLKTEYLSNDRTIIGFEAPLIDIIIDLHDKLKSASSGFASMNYTVSTWKPADLVKVDIMVAGEKVDALSRIMPKETAFQEAKALVARLKKVIPRQQFDVAVQAAIGGKIIARETVKQYRKNVTGGLYGGDITRKKKLLDIQKRGKKKMRDRGRIDIPQEAFLAVLKKD